jgi:anti-sigma regulatory factor (Ser/Thr protein kinase)
MRPCEASSPPAGIEEPALDLHFRATADAVAGVRVLLARCLDSLGVAGPTVDDVVLVASELCANAAVHGGHEAWVQLWACSEGLEVRVSDSGFWTREGTGGLAPLDAEGGRGLAIVSALSERVRISRDAGRTVVNCRLQDASSGRG